VATDEQVIEGILQQLETAWNRYDSISFAEAFVEDANFIHIFGGQLDGRPAIEAAHRNIFETIYKGSHASFVVRGIRFLRPDVAVVFARAQVKFTEGNEPREIETRPTLVVIKEQDSGKLSRSKTPRFPKFQPQPKPPHVLQASGKTPACPYTRSSFTKCKRRQLATSPQCQPTTHTKEKDLDRIEHTLHTSLIRFTGRDHR